MNNEETHLITYYNSPTTDLNIEMLEYIEKTFINYIICGDSNSKNKAFGCKENNKNGNSLIDFISNNNGIILNNKEPTFFRDYINYTEILDLLISSIVSYRNIKNFEVCIEIDLFSGQYPIKIDLLVKINFFHTRAQRRKSERQHNQRNSRHNSLTDSETEKFKAETLRYYYEDYISNSELG
jgi:hypothetical protein